MTGKRSKREEHRSVANTCLPFGVAKVSTKGFPGLLFAEEIERSGARLTFNHSWIKSATGLSLVCHPNAPRNHYAALRGETHSGWSWWAVGDPQFFYQNPIGSDIFVFM